MRPPIGKRCFISDAVEAEIVRIGRNIADRELRSLFEICFPNTLDTTVTYGELDGKPDTFVITGDIDAMWLRDSTAQVWPYVPFAREDGRLKAMLEGAIRRQTKCILVDPYANAFNYGRAKSQWQQDLTAMKPELHERKWEIDSLCYPIRLAYGYWKTTGDASPFDGRWRKAMEIVVKTFREQQRISDMGPYRFQRVSAVPYDTVPLGGYGNPARPCGMIHSAFRPSDDACVYPLLVPSNLFASTSLIQLGEIIATELNDNSFAGECLGLADEVGAAVRAFARSEHLHYGEIYAYEVDGFGNRLFMDDANMPSLLSLPYLGCCSATDPVYRNTRHFVLGRDNPYFFSGSAADGIGGPHVGLNMVWPLSIIMRALTSVEDEEILRCVRMLRSTHANTGFMHESFHKDDPETFTRPWFAWANTLFGELIVKLHNEKPHVLGAV